MGKPAVVQSAPDDPQYLFDPANTPEPTWLHHKYLPASGVLVGLFTPLYYNYAKRRPLYSGIQITIASVLLGFGFGSLVEWKNTNYWADRDAIYRHYIALHPEDFPAKERVVIGDMLKPWYPAR